MNRRTRPRVALKGGNEFFAVFCDSLDVEALQESVDELVARHSALRLRFRSQRRASPGAAESPSTEDEAAKITKDTRVEDSLPLFFQVPEIAARAKVDMEVVDCGSHTDGTVVDMVSECCHASFWYRYIDSFTGI